MSADHRDVPAGPRPEQLYPHVRKRDGGGQSQPCRRTAELRNPTRPRVSRGVPGRSVPASRSRWVRPEWHVPSRPGEGRRDRQASVPRHDEGAVTVGVTAHGVKRSRPAGPGAAREPTRRGSRPAGAVRIMPCGRRNLPPVGIRAKPKEGGAGVLQGMKQQGWKIDGESKHRDRKPCAMQWLSRCTCDHVTRCNVRAPACTSWRPLPRHQAESSGPVQSVARAAVRDQRSRRRRLVSKSVPHTCRSAGARWLV